jgi:hypothetical protein
MWTTVFLILYVIPLIILYIFIIEFAKLNQIGDKWSDIIVLLLLFFACIPLVNTALGLIIIFIFIIKKIRRR